MLTFQEQIFAWVYGTIKNMLPAIFGHSSGSEAPLSLEFPEWHSSRQHLTFFVTDPFQPDQSLWGGVSSCWMSSQCQDGDGHGQLKRVCGTWGIPTIPQTSMRRVLLETERQWLNHCLIMPIVLFSHSHEQQQQHVQEYSELLSTWICWGRWPGEDMQVHALPHALFCVALFSCFKWNLLWWTNKSVFLSSVSHSSKLSNLKGLWESLNLQPVRSTGACTWHLSKNCLEKVSPWPKHSVLIYRYTRYITPWNAKKPSGGACL